VRARLIYRELLLLSAHAEWCHAQLLAQVLNLWQHAVSLRS